MGKLLLLWTALLVRDEAALRDGFTRDIQSQEASRRVEAIRKLTGAKEEKTIELLAQSLKDTALEVRKAAAETLGACTDGAGKAIKPLGELLLDKKEDLDLRMSCAKALAKSRYRAEPFQYFLKTMLSISRDEKHLHQFGADVTGVLDKFIGKSFGMDKTTTERWEEWWVDNKEAVLKEDEKKREEWKQRKE